MQTHSTFGFGRVLDQEPTFLIRCPSCGAKNRASAATSDPLLACGKCRAQFRARSTTGPQNAAGSGSAAYAVRGHAGVFDRVADRLTSPTSEKAQQRLAVWLVIIAASIVSITLLASWSPTSHAPKPVPLSQALPPDAGHVCAAWSAYPVKAFSLGDDLYRIVCSDHTTTTVGGGQ